MVAFDKHRHFVNVSMFVILSTTRTNDTVSSRSKLQIAEEVLMLCQNDEFQCSLVATQVSFNYNLCKTLQLGVRWDGVGDGLYVKSDNCGANIS